MEDRVLLWLNIFLHYFRTMYKIFLSYDKPNIYIRGLYTHYTSLDILIHPKLFLVVVQVRLFQGIGNLPQWNFRIYSIVVEDTHWMIPPEMKHVFCLAFFVERKGCFHITFPLFVWQICKTIIPGVLHLSSNLCDHLFSLKNISLHQIGMSSNCSIGYNSIDIVRWFERLKLLESNILHQLNNQTR